MGGKRTPTYTLAILVATPTDAGALVALDLLLLAVVLGLADRLAEAHVVVREGCFRIGLVHVREQVALGVEDVAARAANDEAGAVRGVCGGHGVLPSDTTFITHDVSHSDTLAQANIE